MNLMKKPKEINQLGEEYNNGTIKNGFKLINEMDYEDLYILRQAMIKWRVRGDDIANILDLFNSHTVRLFIRSLINLSDKNLFMYDFYLPHIEDLIEMRKTDYFEKLKAHPQKDGQKGLTKHKLQNGKNEKRKDTRKRYG